MTKMKNDTIEEMEEFYESCNIFADDEEFTDEELDDLLIEDF